MKRFSDTYFFNSLFSLIGILVLGSCAQVVMPTGGEKDKTPPFALSYIPDSASTNFNSKTIAITFDEYIALSNVDKQLVISPPLENKPSVQAKGKILFIEFQKDEVLQPNTTYTFNFGNSLKDINEGNSKENFKYLFSTGTFIDSLSLKGNVKNAFTRQNENGVLILLYNNFNDSVVYQKLPNYFAKSNENGNFQINNIREGKYKIVALADENFNYFYEEGKEKIAFLVDSIDVSKDQHIQLEMFKEPVKELYIKKRVYNSYGKVLIVFNKPTDNIRVKPLNHTFLPGETIVDFSKTNDSLTYWFKECNKDSLILEVSNDNTILDTLEFALESKEHFLKDKKNPLVLKLENNPNGNQRVDLNAAISFVFNNPIDSINNTLKIELLEDSIAYPSNKFIRLNKSKKNNIIELVTWESDSSGVKVSPLVLKEKTAYHLFIPPNSVTDIFGLQNDSITIDFRTQEKSYYGTLALSINFTDTVKSSKDTSNYIIQLLNSNESVIREQTFIPGEQLYFEYLQPQKYILKIIVDENQNGKWDNGSYLKKVQPEKVIYYTETITVRSNWDLEVKWNYHE